MSLDGFSDALGSVIRAPVPGRVEVRSSVFTRDKEERQKRIFRRETLITLPFIVTTLPLVALLETP